MVMRRCSFNLSDHVDGLRVMMMVRGVLMMSRGVVVSLVEHFFDQFEFAVPISILGGGSGLLRSVSHPCQINGVFFLLVVLQSVVGSISWWVVFVDDLVNNLAVMSGLLRPQVSIVGEVLVPRWMLFHLVNG